MITIGVDYHKKTSSYHVLNEDGALLKRCKLINDPELFVNFINSFECPKQLAMEATRSWDLFYSCIKDHVNYFYLGHPTKMKLITQGERKNDKNDAKHIAELTSKNYLPQAYVSTETERQLRTLVRTRGQFVKDRRSIKNRIHAIIDRNIWACHKPQSFKSLFCKRGITWLRIVELPEKERIALDAQLEHLYFVIKTIEELEKNISQCEIDFPNTKHLRTVPGFRYSIVNLYTVLVETGDVSRFFKAKGYAYYAGLVPREKSSGEKRKTGRLVKGANMHLRTALIESTLAAIRVDKGLQKYYKQVKARNGSGNAIVATARKLAYSVYYVLKEQRPYYFENMKHAPVAACHSSSTSFKK